ncbi:bifunctional ornithine acetyltransferase/N-acetylglutamate synthase [Gloeothece verrucosa]|uniref:Arginine biosynthesis bifunctional protein ArgJ n=1 Tax=Gloeothece verrucosa (strain PCC 7822) TaxID=497965 RepID=E0UC35_GLOV7|nr:bifunctional ornithine acetyltransferase/N-acetylglutamate synthase [Gloeothece verrucosa]ADN16373.1 arginine biosynthesis bifunctional protein ArgJ [Gloeothece verrucosa PCC 7822]
MTDWQQISGGVTAPKGFKAAGITAGLKPSKTPDLALIFSETEAIAGGVFTTSEVRAACVDYCRQRLQAKASARAVLVNAGQANAATGELGWQDALLSAELVAAQLNVAPESILLASTGVIGKRIRMDALKAGIPNLVAALSEDGGEAASKAIITTDLVPKTIALETTIDGRPVRIGGMAKGSGMIHPNMATMLSFITCDGMVATHLWQEMLTRAVNQSFNQITVDGDTSTNDTVIALANGQSRTAAITEMGKAAQKLEAMLTEVCQYLAKAIARDGEGATCLVEVQVSGASDNESARRIARTIAGSSLVKSAIFGRDPNWGRIAAAAGRAGVSFHQEDLRISLGEFLMMDNGQPLEYDRQAASNYLKKAAEGAYLKEDTVLISVCLGNGSGTGTAWGCDLSYDYVKINAEYTT